MRFCQYFGKKRLNILALFRFFKTFCNNNRNTGTSCKICFKLTVKTPERRQCRLPGFFIFNLEHISRLPLLLLLLTLNRYLPVEIELIINKSFCNS